MSFLLTPTLALLAGALAAGPRLTSTHRCTVAEDHVDVLLPDGTVRIHAPVFRFRGNPATTLSFRNDAPAVVLRAGEETPIACETAVIGNASLKCTVVLALVPEHGLVQSSCRWSLEGDAAESLVLEEIVFGRMSNPLPECSLPQDGQSRPVFGPGWFAGVAFPAATTRIEDGLAVLATAPGIQPETGQVYEAHPVVNARCAVGQERESFTRYIQSLLPPRAPCHFNYNSWWTAAVPCTQAELQSLLQGFGRDLTAAHGLAFDSVCIDAGWSEPKSLWQVSASQFPEGLTPVRETAESAGTTLGLWCSPSSCYPFAQDPEWAEANGYETLERASWIPGQTRPDRFCCLGGPRYATAYANAIAGLVREHEITHVKLDGYVGVCPETDHGHEPGPLSADAIARGAVRAFSRIRAANPGVWLEATCFGWNPSPWWLLYVDSVIGTYGDDAPFGRVPCPVYRESYTTARDYFNLQGALSLPIPVSAQEVLGVIHQTEEPFLNDAVMVLMRGHAFVPLYINPAHMSETRWEQLARIMDWVEQRPFLTGNCRALPPDSWRGGRHPRFTNDAPAPREPYGYAHSDEQGGAVVALRNPWFRRATYTLRLDAELGLRHEAVEVCVRSIYPEARTYAVGRRFGDTIEVPLAPYETLVLELGPIESTPEMPGTAGRAVEVARADLDLAGLEVAPDATRLTADTTPLLPEAERLVRARLSADLDLSAPDGDLLVLLESKGPNPPRSPQVRSCRINGASRDAEILRSDMGWSASLLPVREFWTFVRVPLTAGQQSVELELLTAADWDRGCAFVWAHRPGRPDTPAGEMPQPERISLDSAVLADAWRMPDVYSPLVDIPVERIDGVYLDAVDPLSAEQGWGELQRNRNLMNGGSLAIAGWPVRRGLCTHANARLVYAVDGQYVRFRARVGLESAATGTIVCEVRADGETLWRSGVLRRDTPEQRVDVDITGAERLELVVEDAGDGIISDHAAWGEACLLRSTGDTPRP